jgi:hypothetical protein
MSASFRRDCTNCQGTIDFAGTVDHATVIAGVCPMCRGEVRLERRCAGNLEEVAGEWWQFCDCCLSYWRFAVPEPVPGKIVMDSAVTLAEGPRTRDSSGELGKYTPEWFERPGDCWPL